MFYEQVFEKLKILSDAAKYDVSCSSSGASKANVEGSKARAYGVCHSFTADGRCISLLKILLSNDCAYNCLYCANRQGADVARVSFTPDEICLLTDEFFKRNYIEGLFLSSAILKNPDYTMELLTQTVIKLRQEYNFRGYIHLKGIPSANQILIDRAASFVDRMSLNIELPSEQSLKLLAPQKSKTAIINPMRALSEKYIFEKQQKGLKKKIIPAGQTTQMIVGASPESDGQILKLSSFLYNKYALKRVYFSAFAVNEFNHNSLLPSVPAQKIRENRLYQADWLMRFYGFSSQEIVSENENLSLELDPKCNWAIKNPQIFPLEVNSAPVELLVRVPGIGLNGAYKIIKARAHKKLDIDDLKRMRIVLKRAKHFITAGGKFYGVANTDSVRFLLAAGEGKQMNIFDTIELQHSLITGEL